VLKVEHRAAVTAVAAGRTVNHVECAAHNLAAVERLCCTLPAAAGVARSSTERSGGCRRTATLASTDASPKGGAGCWVALG